MANKKATGGKTTELRLHVPEDLKRGIMKFRGQSFIDGKPITSDEKAILILSRRQLKAEGIAA